MKLLTNSQIPNTKYQIPNTKYQIPNTKYQIPNTKYQIPNTNKTFTKTVFDPEVYPNIENMTNTASAKALRNYQADGNAAQTVEVDGIKFEVRITTRPGEQPSVRTAYPIGTTGAEK